MTVLYLPLYRTAVSFTVNVGRRWSILEHLVLWELSQKHSTADQLSVDANVPVRLIIEALINLLQANWIEVRVSGESVHFAATAAGKSRAKEDVLPTNLRRSIRWASLCIERATGAWFSADELDLVYEKDLPVGAEKLEPRIYTYDHVDPSIRGLLPLGADESLAPVPFNFSTPSRPYARVAINSDGDFSGLPTSAPIKLINTIRSIIEAQVAGQRYSRVERTHQDGNRILDTLEDEDIIVGGPEHLQSVRDCIDAAHSQIFIHSCFVSPATIERLLPDFEKAARRNVKIDLLWGLHVDPEKPEDRKPISESETVLDKLGAALRQRVQLSPNSSGSHSKIVVFDDRRNLRRWTAIVGSCNYLSSDYDSLEISIRSRSRLLVSRLTSFLLSAQVPASNAWPPVARRIDNVWAKVKKEMISHKEEGQTELALLVDHDHYAYVTDARDYAKDRIQIGCDLFGLSAETSVLVPMERAAQLGIKVRAFFQRPSRKLLDEGRTPEAASIRSRGISIDQIPDLHGKFIIWDTDQIAVTSFNWMSTVVDGARARGAEIGLSVYGSNVGARLAIKLSKASNGLIDLASEVESQKVAIG